MNSVIRWDSFADVRMNGIRCWFWHWVDRALTAAWYGPTWPPHVNTSRIRQYVHR
jgi:hypothetical protein